MIKYYKLWRLLDERGMKKKELRELLSPNTVAKLSRGANVTTDSINMICKFLDVQPGDIMEYVPDKK